MATNNNHSSSIGNSSGRDGIAIAFTQSQYPTPYTDQRIPGSTPGHRLRRLGRQHQPEDILYNHLSHALVAHGDGGGNANSTCGVVAEPWEGNADHPNPPGGNYVLHTKNGGKRHYDEPSGMLSEAPWQPSKRIIVPLQEEERQRVPQRRGRGVFNTDDGWIHPEAAAAEQQRELAEQRRLERGGKARVKGPPNHTLAELGFMQQQQQTQPTGTKPPMDGAVEGAPLTSSSCPRQTTTVSAAAATKRATVSNYEDDAARNAAAAARAARLAEDTPANSAYNGRTLLPSSGAGVPPARGTAAEADAVADYHRDQRMRTTLHQRKEAHAATATRTADVQSVRELPNW